MDISAIPAGKIGFMVLKPFGAYKTGDCIIGELIDGIYYVDGIKVIYDEHIIRLTEVSLGYFN